jgi:hypothetical protein
MSVSLRHVDGNSHRTRSRHRQLTATVAAMKRVSRYRDNGRKPVPIGGNRRSMAPVSGSVDPRFGVGLENAEVLHPVAIVKATSLAFSIPCPRPGLSVHAGMDLPRQLGTGENRRSHKCGCYQMWHRTRLRAVRTGAPHLSDRWLRRQPTAATTLEKPVPAKGATTRLHRLARPRTGDLPSFP